MKLLDKIKQHSLFTQGRLLMELGLRNLFRQKRRNVLLGIAMSFGVMILVVANSFSSGVSDVLFNKVVVYVSGHVGVVLNEGHGRNVPIFRDKERLFQLVKENTDNLVDIDEAAGVFTRVLGNGTSENMMLIGVDVTKKMTKEQEKSLNESFRMLEGKFTDLANKEVENPAIISLEKSKSLNVKKNDIISVRFRTINGQDTVVRMTIIGIMSNDNVFMSGIIFSELSNVKELMGYRPYEATSLQVTIKDPEKNAIKIADKLHNALQPGLAFIVGDLKNKGNNAGVTLVPYKGDKESQKIIKDNFKLAKGKVEDITGKEGVMISQQLARKFGIGVGQKITVTYKPKFENGKVDFTFTVKGIYQSENAAEENIIFLHENVFYKQFYDSMPDIKADLARATLPKKESPYFSTIGTEWILLDRSRTTEDMMKKNREMAKKKVKAATVDITSMYESASAVLKLQAALGLITFAVVLILFFIILIGVINTLRMTIKERTREIGTIRAIGMQKKDVRRVFVLETFFLAFFASIVGTIVSFIVMGLLSLIKFNLSDNPMGMLLVNGHLHFLPTVSGVIGVIIFITAMASVIAYFPARSAAKLSAAEALRHYE